MGFSTFSFITQKLFDILSSNIKKLEVAKERGKGIIQKTVAYKHYLIIENII